MINKNKQENIYYIDRNSNIVELIETMEKRRRRELFELLEAEKGKLQDKAGQFRVIKETIKIENSELDKLNYFFRTAVVPYYFRQEYGVWDEKLKSDELQNATDEMKRRVGFVLYDSTGHKTKNANSILTFKNTVDFTKFLKALEEVCFDDNDYMFPNSEHYLRLIEKKGRDGAKKQVLEELIEYTKNKHQDRKI